MKRKGENIKYITNTSYRNRSTQASKKKLIEQNSKWNNKMKAEVVNMWISR